MRRFSTIISVASIIFFMPATQINSSAGDSLELGDPAPFIEGVKWLRGGPIDRWQPGHVYILDFWATWCAPCLTQMPAHQALQDRYSDGKVQVIGIAIWSEKGPKTPAEALALHPGLKYAVAEDVGNHIAGIFMDGTKMRGLPALMLVDQKGRLVWVGDPGEEFDAALDAVVRDSFDIGLARNRDELRRKSQDMFAEIDEHRRTGNPRLAAERVDDVIALDPERNGWAYAMKYEIFITDLNDRKAAEAAYQNFMAGEPGQNAFFNYVFVLRMLRATKTLPPEERDLDTALRLAQRAVELSDQPNPDYLANLAQVHFLRGETSDAIRCQRKAIEAAPSAQHEPLTATLREYELAGVPATAVVAAPDRFVDIRSDILARIAAGELPSFAVGVLKDGEILWEETLGWADVDAGVPATPKTAYLLASLGKSVTATAVMTLVQHNRVRLDEAIDVYFDPKVRLTAHEGHAADATLRSVLNMTSSIPHGELSFSSRQDFDAYTSTEMVRNRGMLIFPPGEMYVYSNFAYGMLEHVIEHVSGVSFSAFLKQEVFGPLGMKQAFLFADAPLPGVDLVSKYAAQGQVADTLYSVPQSSLGMHASLEDLMRYARFHLKWPLPDQQKILSEEWLDRMHKDRPDLDALESLVALGWGSIDLEGNLWLLTNGRASGAQSTLSMIPSEALAVVCLTNITGNVTDEMAFRISDALVPGFLKRIESKVAAWEMQTAPPFEPIPELLGRWQGTIRASGREIPLSLLFQADGGVLVSLDNEAATQLENVRYEECLLTGEFKGECAIDRYADGAQTIQLGLRLRNDLLSGYAKSIFSTDAGFFALPAYASLTK